MKCPPCEKNKCHGQYENRHLCDGGNCRCVCQITVVEEIFETGAPIVAGVVLVAGKFKILSSFRFN